MAEKEAATVGRAKGVDGRVRSGMVRKKESVKCTEEIEVKG